MKHPFRAFFLGLFVILVGLVSWAATSENVEISMVREVPSEVAPETLGMSLHFTSNWTRWHHFAKEAARVGFRSEPVAVAEQYLIPGALVRLAIEPKDQSWRRFHLTLEAVDYVPQRKLTVRLVDDSTGKLPKLVSGLGWTIEILPGAGGGSLIRATVRARTENWRARLFAAIARKILLNQVLMADVLNLATIRDPKALNPATPLQQ